jgi:aconitase A
METYSDYDEWIDNKYYYEYKIDKSIQKIEDNKKILLDEMIRKIGITEEDLKKDSSWIKAKIRDSKISDIID